MVDTRRFHRLLKRRSLLGGGPVGCELAQSFARLGSHVTQVEMSPRLMPREDLEVAVFVESTLSADAVDVLTDHKGVRCERNRERKFLTSPTTAWSGASSSTSCCAPSDGAPGSAGTGWRSSGFPWSAGSRPTNIWRRSTNILAAGMWQGRISSRTRRGIRPGTQRSTRSSVRSRSSRRLFRHAVDDVHRSGSRHVGLREQDARE